MDILSQFGDVVIYSKIKHTELMILGTSKAINV